jgi:enhancing lycopene biosynthesis protein 2
MSFRTRNLYKLISVVAVMAIFTPPAMAATTNITQLVTPGLLTLTAPTSASLPSAVTNADADGTSQGPIGTTQVMDNRGTYAGWSLTATTTNFSQVKPPVASRQGSPTVTSSGSYSGVLNGSYVITITTAGSPGTAQFSYNGLENNANVPVPVSGNVAVGSRGVLVNFGAGAYQVGDQYTVETDQMQPVNIMLTPGTFTTIDGASSGVHSGSAHQFSTTTDSATLLTADSGSGFGFYAITPTMRLTISARSPIGTYSETLTETLN